MAYGKSKNLTKITQSDNLLRNNVLKLHLIENMKDVKED